MREAVRSRHQSETPCDASSVRADEAGADLTLACAAACARRQCRVRAALDADRQPQLRRLHGRGGRTGHWRWEPAAGRPPSRGAEGPASRSSVPSPTASFRGITSSAGPGQTLGQTRGLGVSRKCALQWEAFSRPECSAQPQCGVVFSKRRVCPVWSINQRQAMRFIAQCCSCWQKAAMGCASNGTQQRRTSQKGRSELLCACEYRADNSAISTIA